MPKDDLCDVYDAIHQVRKYKDGRHSIVIEDRTEFFLIIPQHASATWSNVTIGDVVRVDMKLDESNKLALTVTIYSEKPNIENLTCSVSEWGVAQNMFAGLQILSGHNSEG